MFETALPPSGVDQDTSHGFGRGGEEMTSAFPAPGLFDIYQADIRLVDQGRGLEGLAGPFLGQLCAASLRSSS